MPIFECTSCHKRLKAPDDAAGRKTVCPYCKTNLVVPGPVLEPEPVYEPEPLYPPEPARPRAEDEAYSLEPPARRRKEPEEEQDEETDRRPCPMCGELIKVNAVKCRYCGEIFDETLRRKSKKKGRQGEDDSSLSGGDIAAAVLCSGIACIFGVVWMIQGKPKGIKMVGLSLLFSVLWTAIRLIITEGMHK